MEIRLNATYSYVDYFVIVEFPKTKSSSSSLNRKNIHPLFFVLFVQTIVPHYFRNPDKAQKTEQMICLCPYHAYSSRRRRKGGLLPYVSDEESDEEEDEMNIRGTVTAQVFFYSLFCLVVIIWAVSSPHMRGVSRWN
ncbi:hypothetical protein LY76DRAFT_171935 [Colletotrichum caudatum]|nr:hypothetical protein LY76DRAFT_171935 [Colletotrichum caudatum]